MNEGLGIPVTTGHKEGVKYRVKDIVNYVEKAIHADDYYLKKARQMTKDAEKAIELTDDVTNRFKGSLDRLLTTEKGFTDASVSMAGKVRDASEKLAQGLARVEKSANFDRLERYVELLERAAVAMNSLAELEKTGKLEKIAGALK